MKPIIGGSKDVEVSDDNWTLKNLLDYLVSKHGEKFTQEAFNQQNGTTELAAKILVNGRHYTHLPLGLETKLSNGDEVSLFPMVAGG